MKILIYASFILCTSLTKAGSDFYKYFTDKTLRFDFILAGNNNKTIAYPVGLKEEPIWAGPVENLIDIFNYGNFKYELHDIQDDKLIYSRGFCTLFQEWQTTPEAKLTERSFYEVATMPFPLNKVRFVLQIRERDGSFSKLYEMVIDPEDYFIRKEKPVENTVTMIHHSGEPHYCLDIVFIAEGYRKEEMAKFRDDAAKMAHTLLNEPPFNDYKNRINVWAIEAASPESGTDVPGEKIYVNTLLNSTFYTFDLERYLTTQDIKTINDYAAAAPHDNIVILINSSRYGGGGIYNYYSGTTVDHPLSPTVFLHEFGHGFAGLADEYFSSEVAYEDFYPLDVEPWEPNITTLVNFESKWKNLIGKNIPVPTPTDPKYQNAIGLFEGAGYSAKGIYRSEIDCRMKDNGPKGFCTVCREAIRKMIEFYTK